MVWHVVLVESHDHSREMYEEWLTRRDGRIDVALMKPCLPAELHDALRAAVSGRRGSSDGPRY